MITRYLLKFSLIVLLSGKLNYVFAQQVEESNSGCGSISKTLQWTQHQEVHVGAADSHCTNGSYIVQVYHDDDYQFGLILPRPGVIADIYSAYIGHQKHRVLVVEVESTGTGGLVFADAFSVGKNGIRLLASVDGIRYPKAGVKYSGDMLKLLRQKLKSKVNQ